jgi:hypothetical protein
VLSPLSSRLYNEANIKHNYQEVEGLTPPHCCACLKPVSGFLTTYFVVIFYVEWFWVRGGRFVDIGGVVDHHSFHKQLKYGLHV